MNNQIHFRYRLIFSLILTITLIGTLTACSLSTFLLSDTADPVETISVLETDISAISTKNAHQDEIISYLATIVGVPGRGPATPFPTFTPYLPIIGGILIEEGACCVGGTAGEMIEVEAVFEARNTTGDEVTEMRTLAGGLRFTEAEMTEAEWEPFVPTKTFPVHVAINWVGFYVCVQFRDVEGNLSAVYCDDISVEGAPE